jgi:hypothetical protein
MGKTHGLKSHTRYIKPNPKIPKKGTRSCNLRFTLHSAFDQPVKVPKVVKHDQGSPKIGQGPTVMLTHENEWMVFLFTSS